MSTRGLTLVALPGRYAVHRFPVDAPLPDLAADTPFLTVTRSATELSVVYDATVQLASDRRETDFLLVRAADWEGACQAWHAAGHTVRLS